MAQFNFFKRELSCKIVYYGPGMSGKTTNVQMIYNNIPGANKGKMVSICTEQDRTLFFDFVPIDLGKVEGLYIKLRIFTVPGQVFYNSTRRLVLQGVDGIIFVADSREEKMDENIESMVNLEENLRWHGIDVKNIPIIMQFNKRDMFEISSIEEMQEKVNVFKFESFEAVASKNMSVAQTLKRCAFLVFKDVVKKVNLPIDRIVSALDKREMSVQKDSVFESDKKQEIPLESISPPVSSRLVSHAGGFVKMKDNNIVYEPNCLDRNIFKRQYKRIESDDDERRDE